MEESRDEGADELLDALSYWYRQGKGDEVQSALKDKKIGHKILEEYRKQLASS